MRRIRDKGVDISQKGGIVRANFILECETNLFLTHVGFSLPKISREQVTGLILAGGQGRRVGNKDKGLLNFKNKPLISHQLEWLKPQVGQLLISANRSLSDYESYGVPVLVDTEGNYPGPLHGVLKALEVCKTDWLFVLPVDVPNLPPNLLESLYSSVNIKNKAFYLGSQEREHYLTMLIRSSLLETLADYLANDNKRVSGFLNQTNAECVDLGLPESSFANLNQVDDYQ